jgi:hypothetical protein
MPLAGSRLKTGFQRAVARAKRLGLFFTENGNAVFGEEKTSPGSLKTED